MNRDQLNRTQMINTVANYMAKRSPKWLGIKAISDTMADLGVNVSAITAKLSRQGSRTTAVTEGQAVFRVTVQIAIGEMANRLCAFAGKAQDAELVANSHLTLPMLAHMSSDTVESTGKRILKLITTHLASLEDFGITPVEVQELETLLQMFHETKTAPRIAIAERASETGTFPQLLRDTTRLLRIRLDKLMTRFRLLDPEFYAGYVAARMIISRHGASKVHATPSPAPQSVTPPAAPSEQVTSPPQL